VDAWRFNRNLRTHILNFFKQYTNKISITPFLRPRTRLMLRLWLLFYLFLHFREF